ncbi:MAG TPA: tyrosine--tRNA ligase [Chloroflexota bacterium]|nr:tyrosine--tRNA ligase [Chloroflexota bacterium]
MCERGVPAGALAGQPTPAVRDGHEIDELLTRGVVDVIVRADVEKRLRAGETLRVKHGIDPTGPRLHIGRAVPLRKLRQFQEQGHTICLVIGDFTAQLGDASDHRAARRMLSEQEVQDNMAGYREQIGRILDVDRVEWSYNSSWLGRLGFKDVIGLAQHFTVAQMLERENFRLRYAEGKPIGLHEFFYPLMQGYDSVALGADLEVGGTDQLFNLLAGRTIQRALGQRPQDVMTLQMIWGLDGRKMSTSEGNTILIDEPPVDMYGKIMSMGDEHIIPYFEAATEVPMREIEDVARALEGGLNPMSAKKHLAYEITRLYHGAAGAREGQRYFEELHQQRRELGDEDWPEVAIQGAQPRQVGRLFVDAGLASSNSDARQVMQQGGLVIDGQKVTDFAMTVAPHTGMKLRRGKVRLARLRVISD